MSHQQSVLNPSKGWELKTKQLWTWERSPSHTGKQPELNSIWNGEPYFDSTSCSWASSPVMAGPITIRIEYYFIPTSLPLQGYIKENLPKWGFSYDQYQNDPKCLNLQILFSQRLMLTKNRSGMPLYSNNPKQVRLWCPDTRLTKESNGFLNEQKKHRVESSPSLRLDSFSNFPAPLFTSKST